jgi:hypothetical protein
MKIKEVKTRKSKSQVNELKLSSLIGNYGSAVASQMRGKNAGMTTQDIMTQNIFTKNFLSSALSSLKNAVQSGLVDINKSNPRVAVAKDIENTRTVKVAQPGDIGDITKPAPQAQAPAQAQAQPQAPQAQAPAQAQAQPQTPKGKTVPRQTVAQKVAAQKAAQKAAAQPKQPFAQKAAATKQKQANIKAAGIKNQPVKVKESYYDRLNVLFETILETVMPQESNTYTVKDYLKKVWFPQFMRGVNWQEHDAQIDQLLQQVQDTYAKDQGQAALKKLASFSLAISPRKSGKESSKTEKKPNELNKPITATWGKVQYTKTDKGWVDPKGRLADANTTKFLNQAVSQSTK